MNSIRHFLCSSTVLFVLACRPIAAQAPTQTAASEPRTALIIGVGDYDDDYFAPLQSPKRDADNMEKHLRGLGFEVQTLKNARRRETIEAVDAFGDKLKKRGGVGLFYFSGHGIQHEQQNYMVPLGTTIKTTRDLPEEAVAVQRVLNRMTEAGNSLNLVFLDACRNNTIPTEAKSSGGGLAAMRGGSGLMVFFATQPGQIAYDDYDGTGSLFTAALLKHLETPGLSFMDMMSDVTLETEALSFKGSEGKHKQTPYFTGSLSGRFYFMPQAKPLPGSDRAPDAVPTPTDTLGWEIVHHEGRDYISAESMSRFYRFTNLKRDGDSIIFSSPVLVMKGSAGSTELFINRIKFHLSNAVVSHNSTMLFSRLDLCKLIDPILRPSYVDSTGEFDTVVLDPGQGGSDLGLQSDSGSEKDLTLKLALSLRANLEKRGLKVVMTRVGDVTMTAAGRAAIANQTARGILVSFEFSGGDAALHGIQTLSLAPQGASAIDGTLEEETQAFPGNQLDTHNVALAAALHASTVHFLKRPDLGTSRSRSELLKNLRIPGAIFRGGFVKHADDDGLIVTAAYLDALTVALGDAVANYQRSLDPKNRAKKGK